MNGNIIVVEDDQFSQQFYQYILKKAGYTSLVIENGDEVLARLLQNDISLIIMDINLKNTYFRGEKIDGAFLTKYIKQKTEIKVPVILVTAHSPSIKGQEFFAETLADDFIIKPITDMYLLLGKIEILIKSYGQI